MPANDQGSKAPEKLNGQKDDLGTEQLLAHNPFAKIALLRRGLPKALGLGFFSARDRSCARPSTGPQNATVPFLVPQARVQLCMPTG